MQQTRSAITYYGSSPSLYVTPSERSSSCTYTSSAVLPTSSLCYRNSTRLRSRKYGYSTSYVSASPGYGTGYAGYVPLYTPQAQQLPGPWGTPITNTIPSSLYFDTHAYNSPYPSLPPSPYMASSDPGIGTLIMPLGYPNSQPGATGVPYNTSVDPRRSPYYQHQFYHGPTNGDYYRWKY